MSMKFLFRFKSLLKVRRHDEQTENQKMGALLQTRNRLLKQLSEEEERTRLSFEDTSKNLSPTIRGVRIGYQFMHDKRKTILTLQEEIKKIDEQVEAQQKKLIEANRQVKMIELIETKDKDKFIEEQGMEEQNQQNEIATQMFNRNN